MAIVKSKPTSPGRRFVVKVVNPDLHKGKPHAPLLEVKRKTGGRNNKGRISVRHIGGGQSSITVLLISKEINWTSLDV
jgi:large subunit ribosomal protein L2